MKNILAVLCQLLQCSNFDTAIPAAHSRHCDGLQLACPRVLIVVSAALCTPW